MELNDYNWPLALPNGYFYGRPVPGYHEYLFEYHVHYMRYIFFMCVMNADGEYPMELGIDDLRNGLRSSQGNSCFPRIKKILIGEAPPPNPLNYFYNSSPARWNAITGNPSHGQSWTSTIKNALFPGVGFPDTSSFLSACAKKGFLLLDLFPYAIRYSGRNTISYNTACTQAWGGGGLPYPHNIIGSLNDLLCCIEETISIGFALTRMGSNIVTDHHSVLAFRNWCVAHGRNLNPPLHLDQLRPLAPHVPNAADYLRICHRRPMLTPCARLLNLAGI
jgi:hypothetical protein